MKRMRTTYTTLITEHLRECDDFRTASQLVKMGLCPSYTITKTLLHLRRHLVVDCIEAEGKLFWYALPPEQDDRSSTIAERAVERGRTRKIKPKRKEAE